MKRLYILILGLLVGISLNANQLPNVQLKDINGKTVNVSSLSNNGKPIIISFWATWCKPCLRELKAINELYPDWQDETGVQMYIVSVDQAQDVQKVKPLVDGNGWEYNVLLDPNGELKRALNVQAVPHVIVLDGKGNITYRHDGYTDGAEQELYEIIKAL